MEKNIIAAFVVVYLLGGQGTAAPSLPLSSIPGTHATKAAIDCSTFRIPKPKPPNPKPASTPLEE